MSLNSNRTQFHESLDVKEFLQCHEIVDTEGHSWKNCAQIYVLIFSPCCWQCCNLSILLHGANLSNQNSPKYDTLFGADISVWGVSKSLDSKYLKSQSLLLGILIGSVGILSGSAGIQIWSVHT